MVSDLELRKAKEKLLREHRERKRNAKLKTEQEIEAKKEYLSLREDVEGVQKRLRRCPVVARAKHIKVKAQLEEVSQKQEAKYREGSQLKEEMATFAAELEGFRKRIIDLEELVMAGIKNYDELVEEIESYEAEAEGFGALAKSYERCGYQYLVEFYRLFDEMDKAKQEKEQMEAKIKENSGKEFMENSMDSEYDI